MGSSLQDSLKTALDFMPEHRKHSKRSQRLTLDTLLDDARSQSELAPGTLDLILMAYRFTHLFDREFKLFLKKPRLEPLALKDLFQLVFGALLTRTKTPVSALVSEAVEVARAQFGPQTAGLSNAFFRGITRNLEELKVEVTEHPQILLGPALLERWGATSTVAKQSGRWLSLRPEGGLSAFDASGKFHASMPMIEFLEAKGRGEKFQAMDSGSWIFVEWLASGLKSNFTGDSLKTLLDACAAPGGKLIALSTQLPALFSADSKIKFFASDSKMSRIETLRSNLKTWGLENRVETQIRAWGEPPREASSWPETFDAILADLPCSGLGTLHSRPDIVAEDPAKRVQDVAALQSRILKDLISKLGPSAKLFASICSVDPVEIAHISKELGKNAPDFSSWSEASSVAREGITAWVFSR